VIHADIKPDNILVGVNYETQRITELKLIDFGSAFMSDQVSAISATTPEYLAPEVLDYIENRGAGKMGNNSQSLTGRQQPWSYDIWSLGAILLEILTGIPIWMSLKSRATT
jgi:dual specificity tyrosine-phosphorylation-regulated kinase 2/3/4